MLVFVLLVAGITNSVTEGEQAASVSHDCVGLVMLQPFHATAAFKLDRPNASWVRADLGALPSHSPSGTGGGLR